jgi:hypothetical protein
MNSIKINDNFIINDITKKKYYENGKFDEKLIIENMRRIMNLLMILIYFMLRQ